MPKNNKTTPLLIGLTGGIGAGKTLIAKMFELLRVPVFDADTEAKAILGNDQNVRARVIEIFGPEAYSGSEPNRKFLAQRVFANDEKREKLNAIVHPAVGEAFKQWVKDHSDNPYLLKEAAIIFETGGEAHLDGVVIVTAPEVIRIERVMQRDNVTENQVRDRMAAQWTDEKKLEKSNYHIVNDGKTAVIPQVLAIHDALLKEVKRKYS